MTVGRERAGDVFDTVAAEYDRNRPTYPDELVQRACAGLAPGDQVLEVGCGTGQLTAGLVARGLRVTAVDPGARLLALAAARLEGVRFVNAPFEEAEIPGGRFRTVFSASAFHWVDPDVSWARAADALEPGGTLALLQYCGVAAEDDQEAVMGALERTAPEVAAAWPTLRSLEAIMAGISERAENVSEVWSWVGQYDLARAAGRLFEPARGAAVPVVMEHRAADLVALLRTLSPYHDASADQRARLEASVIAMEEELGRPIRSTTAAVLVTARRVAS